MLDLRHPPLEPLVAPSVLSADFGRIADDCGDTLSKGADLLHVDVMDGHFVPNITMGVDMIRGLRRHFPGVLLDVHLMVERPEDYVESFAEAGANHFTFHVEVTRPLRPEGVDPDTLIRKIRQNGMTVGMVMNPPTPVESIQPWLSELDLILVMSVNPGRSGQAFLPATLDKVRWLSEVTGRHQRIEMDGGMNSETCQWAVQAGVDVLVTGSALFGAADRASVIRAMHHARQGV